MDKENLKETNDTLDKLLLLLLGDNYDGTITERELFENYGYPDVTDAELPKMEVDHRWRIERSIELNHSDKVKS